MPTKKPEALEEKPFMNVVNTSRLTGLPQCYLRKEIKAGKHVMVVYDEYIIPFHGIMTKAYAEMLAKLFLNTDGSMKRWQVCNIKKKLHKKTYSIQ